MEMSVLWRVLLGVSNDAPCVARIQPSRRFGYHLVLIRMWSDVVRAFSPLGYSTTALSETLSSSLTPKTIETTRVSSSSSGFACFPPYLPPSSSSWTTSALARAGCPRWVYDGYGLHSRDHRLLLIRRHCYMYPRSDGVHCGTRAGRPPASS
jgi:hypothetical protein